MCVGVQKVVRGERRYRKMGGILWGGWAEDDFSRVIWRVILEVNGG